MNEQNFLPEAESIAFRTMAPPRLILPALIIAGFLLSVGSGLAQNMPTGFDDAPTNTPLASWSFYDNTNWTDDQGYPPISFTNLNSSWLGDGAALVVDTNRPAWLIFNVVEPKTGATNLALNGPGSIRFWFAPAGWASTNAGGTGPGQWAQLINVGEWTPDASYGYWGLAVDPAGRNLWFQSQDGDGNTYSLSAPISWTTNYFHAIDLTYSSTNVSLYLDGQLATNDPGGLNLWPGPGAVAGGIYFGSETNGLMQAGGSFNSVATYNVPVDAGTIQQTFHQEFVYYVLSPWNTAMFTLTNAVSSPSWTNGFEAISGAGNLQLVTSGVSGCVNGANPYQIWFTNVTALATNGGTSLTFTIEGGEPGYFYDVFATGALESPLTNSVFVWLGQGQACSTYTVGIIKPNSFFILGTPYSTCGCGLTDAYLSLVAKVSPAGPQQDSYGVPYAWYAENGLVPITSGLATQDADQDGLLNYQEYFYGTRPNVSEGFAIWTTIGTTSIP